MKIQQTLFMFLTALISLSLASMHHENPSNFSECKGQVVNLYVSKILENAPKIQRKFDF